jgi:serine/threonine protein phosphatase 1
VNALIQGLRQVLRREPEPHCPAVADGMRVYAIGDVHGRLDLLSALAVAIEADDAARPAAETCVILLGDLVDRGPDSAGVIAFAMGWSQRRTVRHILGNHEEMLLHALERKGGMRVFVRNGGAETILSYGVDTDVLHASTLSEAMELATGAIPPAHIAFLRAAEPYISCGDYLFVHAGIAPGVPLEQQAPHDLRWIREPFLVSDVNHGAVVVHGHTIAREAEIRPNRIGIDTGAFMTGRLTALGLEGTQRWLVEAQEAGAGEDAQGITTAIRPC